jgi:chromosome segregation ATPase
MKRKTERTSKNTRGYETKSRNFLLDKTLNCKNIFPPSLTSYLHIIRMRFLIVSSHSEIGKLKGELSMVEKEGEDLKAKLELRSKQFQVLMSAIEDLQRTIREDGDEPSSSSSLTPSENRATSRSSSPFSKSSSSSSSKKRHRSSSREKDSDSKKRNVDSSSSSSSAASSNHSSSPSSASSASSPTSTSSSTRSMEVDSTPSS